jgi:2-polyprenyl-3-methyl-5-hydroxy-6-metoxy-1,4-benzoquinol methylase
VAAVNALSNTRTTKTAGEVGPDAYVQWRACALGAITESLEQALVLELSGPLSGKTVLDVGCGDGTLTRELRRKGAAFVAGCDPDWRMIATARAHADGDQTAVTYLLGRAEHLPFRAQSFDIAIAVAVLCFVQETSVAVGEMARVLKPGGCLVVGALSKWSTWAASRRIRAWLGSKFWQQARFMTVRDLRSLATGAGLRPERLCGAVYYPRLTLAARAMAPLDPILRRITTFGAAFIALQAIKAP